MNDYDKVSYWLDMADYDLQTAKVMLEGKRYLYVGFMCHQVAEKALKAIFVARNPDETLPYIHSPVKLANLSGISQEINAEQLSLLSTLAPLNIEARYPEEKEKLLATLTHKYCAELITRTEALLSWLKTKC